jgi:hypothetical protein
MEFDIKDKIEVLGKLLKSKDLDLDKINENNVKISDIKFTKNVKEISKQVFNGSFKVASFMPNQFLLKRQDLPLMIMVDSNTDISANNLVSPLNFDNYLSYLFSPLVLNGNLRNILLPISNFDIQGRLIYDLMTKINYNGNINIDKNKYYSVRVRESFDKSRTLKQYVDQHEQKGGNKLNLKPILFQIVDTINTIKSYYPEFKHGNINENNIHLFKSNKVEEKDGFKIKYHNNFVKLSNFENAKLTDKIKSESFKNIKEYHYLAKYLLEQNIDDETKEFLNKMKKYKVSINDNYFKSLILQSKSQSDISKSDISKSDIDIKMEKEEDFLGLQDTENLNEMIGGFNEPTGKTIPNDPSITNDKRNVFMRKKEEERPPREPKVLAEQKIYDFKPEREKPVYHQPFIPIGQSITNPLQSGMILPYSSVLNKVPIQKIYNISIGDPSVDTNILHTVYEDMLPGDKYPLNNLTLENRKQIRNFIRSLIIKERDGEIMNIAAGAGSDSFRSYFRIGKFNPYSISQNPYDDLAKGFTLYSSAYPLRLDDKSFRFSIGKGGLNFNVRTYGLTYLDFNFDRISPEINENDLNLIRELKYYKLVNKIIQDKESPNFANMILYKTDVKTRIKYDKLMELKSKKIPQGMLKAMFSTTRNIKNLTEKIKRTEEILTLYGLRKEDINLEKETDKSLIILTEGPHQNIIKWASPIYNQNGAKKIMAATGHHSKEVWFNVIFQILYAYMVMDKYNVYFKEMSLERSIFICDIYYEVSNTGYWKYIVDNIEYYIPNKGFIVMLDSYYSDLFDVYSLKGILDHEFDKEINNEYFKIFSNNLFENNNEGRSENDIKQNIKDGLISMLDPMNLKRIVTHLRIIKPEDEVFDLLEKIVNTLQDNTKSIKDAIIENMGMFLHNRVGSQLTITERQNLSIIPNRNFKQGTLIVYEERFDEFRWAIYYKPDTTINRHFIIIKVNDNYEKRSVFLASIRTYSVNLRIQDSGEFDSSYENLLEIYQLK